MNENTENMVKELQKEFLKNWGDISKGLKVTIIDGAKLLCKVATTRP